MNLIKLDEFEITSTVSSVILGGGSNGSSGLNITMDDTYNVYKVFINNAHVVTDQTDLRIRFTVNGVSNTTANYQTVSWHLNAAQAYNSQEEVNQTSSDLSLNTGNSTGEAFNTVLHIFNAGNSSEYTAFLKENTMMSNAAELRGKQGSGLLKVATAVDGIEFIESMDKGLFQLFGITK